MSSAPSFGLTFGLITGRSTTTGFVWRGTSRRADGGSERAGVLLVAHAGQDEGEFVAAGSRDQRALAGRDGKASADFLEHGVAGGMAERVVDRLEPVEIEDAQRNAGAGCVCLCNAAFEVGEELAAVG